MKKLIIITTMIFFSGIYNSAFSGWYSSGVQNITLGDGATECSNDGDITGGEFEFNVGTDKNGQTICGKTVSAGKYSCDHAVDRDNNGIINTNDYTSTSSSQKIGTPLSGNTMSCFSWDDSEPEELSIDYNLGAISSGEFDITIKAKDKGGSKLKKIELYESDNGGAWTNIHTWDNLTDPNNTLVTKVFTKTNAQNGHRYKYKIIAYDYSNNWNPLEKPDIIKVLKPLEYEDNDNYIRKNINGIISPTATKNIFWNNSKIEDYIERNPNNIDNFNVKIGDVTDGFLYLETSGKVELELIKTDKTQYDNFKEFKRLETLTGTINSGSGYIRKDGGNLDLNTTTTGSYSFDFTNNNYILMLKNLENSDFLNYNLRGTNSDSKGIYINPINDSNSNEKGFKVLGYDIIINNRGNIMGKMIEMVGEK